MMNFDNYRIKTPKTSKFVIRGHSYKTSTNNYERVYKISYKGAKKAMVEKDVY